MSDLYLSHGRTLLTSQTKKWSKEQFEKNEAIEQSMVFHHFTVLDQGRSRVLMFSMNTCNPNWEKHRDKIIEAVNNYDTTKEKITVLEQQLAERGAEICKWQSVLGTNFYYPSCFAGDKTSVEMGRDWKGCPYCLKPIKVKGGI